MRAASPKRQSAKWQRQKRQSGIVHIETKRQNSIHCSTSQRAAVRQSQRATNLQVPHAGEEYGCEASGVWTDGDAEPSAPLVCACPPCCCMMCLACDAQRDKSTHACKRENARRRVARARASTPDSRSTPALLTPCAVAHGPLPWSHEGFSRGVCSAWLGAMVELSGQGPGSTRRVLTAWGSLKAPIGAFGLRF